MNNFKYCTTQYLFWEAETLDVDRNIIKENVELLKCKDCPNYDNCNNENKDIIKDGE